MKYASSLLIALSCLSLQAEEPLRQITLQVNVLAPDCIELDNLKDAIPGPAPSITYDQWCANSTRALTKVIDLINSGKLDNDLFWSISIGDKEKATKRLVTIGTDYMNLLNQIAKDSTQDFADTLDELCTPDCKKIVNGAVWYEGREHFVSQLASASDKVGTWSIKPLDVIADRDGRTVVIRFLVPTEKAGTWNTLVILRCNNDFQITEINEIYNTYEG